MKQKRNAKTSAFEQKLTCMLNQPTNPVELVLHVHEFMKVVFTVWPKEHSALLLIAVLQKGISVFEEREKTLPEETQQRMRKIVEAYRERWLPEDVQKVRRAGA